MKKVLFSVVILSGCAGIRVADSGPDGLTIIESRGFQDIEIAQKQADAWCNTYSKTAKLALETCGDGSTYMLPNCWRKLKYACLPR